MFASDRVLWGVGNIEKAKEAISIQEKLGDMIKLDVNFYDETGKPVKLQDYFMKNNLPIVLTPIYYTCPHLCNYLLEGLTDAISQEQKYVLGTDYKVLSVSMNHKDSPEQAQFKKNEYLKKITYLSEGNAQTKNKIEKGWSLLTGEKSQIEAFYKSIGFRYQEEKGEYAHTASLIFLTPKGRVARYLYGIRFQKNDFRLSMLEASQGKISSFVDQVFFYCFRYDSEKRVYNMVAWRVMTIGSLFTILLLIGLLTTLWLKDRSKKVKCPEL